MHFPGVIHMLTDGIAGQHKGDGKGNEGTQEEEDIGNMLLDHFMISQEEEKIKKTVEKYRKQ
jgi:hypothetical protein